MRSVRKILEKHIFRSQDLEVALKEIEGALPNISEIRDLVYKHISAMLLDPIYPTTKCYKNLSTAIHNLMKERICAKE